MALVLQVYRFGVKWPVPEMISVVMTAYNAERFIRQSLESILMQSDQDFECVVVDDGSSDETIKNVRNIGDSRIRIIEAGRIGRGRALNLGVRESRGRYIAIQDADDIAHPFRLEVERKALENSDEFAAVGSDHVMFEGAKYRWKEVQFTEESFSLRNVASSLLIRNPISHTSMMVRRETLEDVGIYNESRTDLFDWDLYIRLTAAGFQIGKFPIPLVAHRIHKMQFFEHMRRRTYVRHCYNLQREARKSLGGGIVLEVIFLLLYAYRLLPPTLRIGWKVGS